MLTDVKIEGLRGVGSVELHFAPEQRVYVLFGANGVGKTKCLEALWQFLLMTNEDFLKAKRRYLELGGTKWVVMASIAVDGDTFDLTHLPDPRQLGIKDARLHQLPVVFLGTDRRASLSAGNVNAVNTLGKTADRREKYFGMLREALVQNDLRSLGMSDNTHAWFVTRAQSSNPYQKSRDNRQSEIEVVLSMLNAIEPRIDPEFLQIDGGGSVFLKVDEEERELGELSSGFAALLKMIQAIVAGYAAFTNEKQLQNVRGIVLIDEIDAHLHAEWQAKIIPCLKALLPNTTFYVATHSPLALTQLKDGEAYLLKRDTDGVVRSQMAEGTSRRLFADMLELAFGVDLNELKHQAMDRDREHNQNAKQKLLSLLRAQKGVEA